MHRKIYHVTLIVLWHVFVFALYCIFFFFVHITMYWWFFAPTCWWCVQMACHLSCILLHTSFYMFEVDHMGVFGRQPCEGSRPVYRST